MSDIEGDELEFERGQINQKMSCSNCGLAWWDIYELTAAEVEFDLRD